MGSKGGNSSGRSELPPLDRARAVRRALFAPLLEYARLGAGVHLGQPSDYVVEGDPAVDVVVVTPKSGLDETFGGRWAT